MEKKELKYYKIDFTAKILLVHDAYDKILYSADNSTFSTINIIDNTLEYYTEKDSMLDINGWHVAIRDTFDFDKEPNAIVCVMFDEFNDDPCKIKIDGEESDVISQCMRGYVMSDIKNPIASIPKIIMDYVCKIFKQENNYIL